MWKPTGHPSIITNPQFRLHSNQLVRLPCVKGDNSLSLILPVHFSFNVHNINQIDIQNSTSQVNATLTLAVKYKDFNLKGQKTQQLVKILSDNIQIKLSHQENINLTKKNKNVELIDYKDKGFLVFKVRQDFGAIFVEDVRLTPIQKLSIIFSLKVSDISVQFKDIFDQKLLNIPQNAQQTKSLVKIKFSLMQFKYNYELSKNDEFQKSKTNVTKRKLNLGGQIYFEDQLNIGQYEILTKQTQSQTSIYRIPYRIAKAKDLQIVSNKTEIQYAKVTKKSVNQKKKDKYNLASSTKSMSSSAPKDQFQRLLKVNENDTDIQKSGIIYYQRVNELLAMSSKQELSYKLRSFNTIHLTITLFRHPTVGILTILFPLLTIAFLNWSIFGIPTGEDGEDIKRLTVIITTIAAFISLVSVVRERIPATDKLTFIQIIVFTQLIPSICAVIQLFRYIHQPAPSWTPQHVVGIFFTFIVLVACMFYFIYFYKFLFKQYKSHFPMVNPTEKKYLLDQSQWQNRKYLKYLEDIKSYIYSEQQIQNQQFQRQSMEQNRPFI